MKNLDGITFIKNSDYALCHINDLTDEIKALLTEQLSFICHGKSASESSYSIYNYKTTLKEFITRYKDKTTTTRKGMIGELLSHIIINRYFNEYNVVSPFFNLEEHSIKKGFDVVLSSKSDNSIWITEVKSGNLHKNSDSNQTTYNLLGTAKRDLLKRLNNNDNRSLWYNAINGAKNALENYGDIKSAIIGILNDYSVKADTENLTTSTDINAFLISSLFSSLSDPITNTKLKKKSDELKRENSFNKLFILSLQKETYSKVYKFLKEESEK